MGMGSGYLCRISYVDVLCGLLETMPNQQVRNNQVRNNYEYLSLKMGYSSSRSRITYVLRRVGTRQQVRYMPLPTTTRNDEFFIFIFIFLSTRYLRLPCMYILHSTYEYIGTWYSYVCYTYVGTRYLFEAGFIDFFTNRQGSCVGVYVGTYNIIIYVYVHIMYLYTRLINYYVLRIRYLIGWYLSICRYQLNLWVRHFCFFSF